MKRHKKRAALMAGEADDRDIAIAEGPVGNRISMACGHVARVLLIGVPSAFFGVTYASCVGYLIRNEACNFVQSAACVVVYIPELFKCDFSFASYAPRNPVSVQHLVGKTASPKDVFLGFFPLSMNYFTDFSTERAERQQE